MQVKFSLLPLHYVPKPGLCVPFALSCVFIIRELASAKA